ncbi:MAG TPA: muconate/chloromuconate family cycloisomerase [Dietzia timorensis]|uniref:Muconate/chloromuconate family cycloisomerase n=1 Tax=Dietzia timorensis TaxID=499555 RepID=A0A921JYB7_9ACTN|nr:muconate/chloromuconate family cycloisomerase [Dietzia timorensis]HJE90738.1 muconate/chloromuconate family cycloisomerase [Dietzia timorensis]
MSDIPPNGGAPKIAAVRSTILDVPLIRPHKFATTTATAQPILLVEVTTEDGITGYGEGVTPGGPWWGGESVETMKALVDKYLAPVVVGQTLDEIPRLVEDFDKFVARGRFAKAGLEIAMFDAYARSLGVPMHALLGGKVRDSIDCTWALGVAPLDEMIGEISEILDSGRHRSFKLKMGSGDPRTDTDRIIALCEHIGDRAGLRIDVNARWDRLTAVRYLPALAEAGIELFEQPTPTEQLGVLAELARLTNVPIMADESVQSPHDALEIVRREAAGVLAIKTTKLGGLLRSKETVAVARAAGLACHAATSLEGPIGTAASLHLACADPGFTFGSELFGPLLLAHELLTEPITYDDGRVHLPEGPGLGVDLDPDAVSRFRRAD